MEKISYRRALANYFVTQCDYLSGEAVQNILNSFDKGVADGASPKNVVIALIEHFGNHNPNNIIAQAEAKGKSVANQSEPVKQTAKASKYKLDKLEFTIKY